MGGSSHSEQKSTSSNQIDPYQMAQYQANYAGAQGRVANLQPYTGNLTAGFNPTQIQAQNTLLSLGNDPRYSGLYNQAIGVNQDILGQTINPKITAGQLSQTDLDPYLNKYTNDVINTSLAQLNQQRGQQQVSDNAAATAAHAFGGTRQAVQNALTSQLYDQNAGSMIANLNAANYSQAQQAALQDIGNRLTADQDTFGNSLAANQFRLGAANNLASLSDAALANNTRQAGLLSAVGDAQQQLQQQEYTNAYNQYLQNINLEGMKQQLLNQALGIIPIQQTTNSDSTTDTHTNPGAMGILGGIASLGLGAATGGSSLGLTGALGGLGSLFGGSVAPTLGTVSSLGLTPFGTPIGGVSSGTPGFSYKGPFG